MKKQDSKKMFYFFIGCILLSTVIIGATFAYFSASSTDSETVKGETATTTFSMYVDKITMIDIEHGLVPMKNSQAPNAAKQLCFDDNLNAGCQIYKITIEAQGTDVFFVDGYISTTNEEGVEIRFTRVYPKTITEDEEEKTIFETGFTNEDYESNLFNENEYIKDGNKIDLSANFNSNDDANCLLVRNEQIGGDAGTLKDFYVMIWVYDNGEVQDFMQGMNNVYRGTATFITATGNEIKASFD